MNRLFGALAIYYWHRHYYYCYYCYRFRSEKFINNALLNGIFDSIKIQTLLAKMPKPLVFMYRYSGRPVDRFVK